MMEAGGHHAALAETLCQIKRRQPNESISVFAHKLLDGKLRERFNASGISIELSFETVFYKHFHGGSVLGPAGLQKYIRVLTLEYKALLESAIKHSSQQPIVIFVPCLNWEHGSALSYAISQLDDSLSNSNIHIAACAMYSPTPSGQEPEIKFLWYKMAFTTLAKCRFVSLYCSEQELCDTYIDLLSFDKCFLHPCYLMDWAGEIPQKECEQATHITSKSYLLYFGDAKLDKGFNRLPEVLKQGLASTGADTEFVIQFTLAWEYPEIMDTVQTLKNWAKTEPRLTLHHGFWTNQEMLKMYRRISGVICTYDINAYKYKSSGLIWMLAFFNKPFVISGRCWLSREAERLSVPMAIDESLGLASFSKVKISKIPTNIGYSEALFMPLNEWLLSH
jgi:hypothetical protein